MTMTHLEIHPLLFQEAHRISLKQRQIAPKYNLASDHKGFLRPHIFQKIVHQKTSRHVGLSKRIFLDQILKDAFLKSFLFSSKMSLPIATIFPAFPHSLNACASITLVRDETQQAAAKSGRLTCSRIFW